MVKEELFELSVREKEPLRRGYSTGAARMRRIGKTKMDVMQLVFVYNLLLMPFGIVLLIVGATAENSVHPYKEYLNGKYHTIALCTIMAGLIDVMSAVFGCYGVLRDRACMLWIYPHLLVLIFFFQIAIAGMSFMYQNEEVISSKMNDSMHHFADFNRSLSTLQTGLQCCGFNNFSDFSNASMPSSCCESHFCSSEEHYLHGCRYALQKHIHTWGNILGIISLILASIEVIGLVMLCFYTQYLTGRRYRRSLLSTYDQDDENYSEDESSYIVDM